MGYSSLRDAINDLEKTGQLIRIKQPIDPNLEMAEIHRRIFEQKGPAILFEQVKGSPFQAVSNVYGTYDRTSFLFRDTLERVKRIVELKIDPTVALKNPLRYLGAPFTALQSLPQKQFFSSAIKYGTTTIDQLPLVKSWPMDGGAFVTLPQVYTEDPDRKGVMGSNVGMYRIQLTGNDYVLNEEIGLHYQLHRGIGVHHTKYNKIDEPFRCSIFVGGPPSHAFTAIMPLPEGLTELTFMGMLGGRRFRYSLADEFTLSGDADFVITGTIIKNAKKRQRPFGDHLGYYSLDHEFPYMKVDKVYHRKNPLWHFTVVGRPPAEDSSFGYLIHEIVKDLAPQEFPGLHEINAVDAAGVHPLLLAIGSERYMPFRDKKPEEILTIANRILGSGQTSLAKYLWISSKDDDPSISTHNIPAFFKHVLERIDWRRDLHFQTKTTIDTLDYSGSSWNGGSKVVMACCGDKLRTLSVEKPDLTLPSGYNEISIALPGILAISAPPFTNYEAAASQMKTLCEALASQSSKLDGLPLVVVCDDASFTAKTLNNYLWVTYTRSNPSHDIYGVNAFVEHKHWGCNGPLVIDARVKPHHAPALVEDPAVTKNVDAIFMEEEALKKYR